MSNSSTAKMIFRAPLYIAGVTAALFAANQLIGGADAAADFKRSLAGGVIGGGLLAAYLPLRSQIRSMINSMGAASAAEASQEDVATDSTGRHD